MAATEAAESSAETPEGEEDRWPLLPDNTLYRAGAVPMMPSQVTHTSPDLRRAAIAATTSIDHLRTIIRYETQLEFPRSEVIAMCNQQIDRVRHEGMGG